MKIKDLKKYILENNNNAIAFTLLNYKSNDYSFNNFVKKIKSIIKEKKIKNFNYLEFFNRLIENSINLIEIDLDEYFDNLIVDYDLEQEILIFLEIYSFSISLINNE